MTDHKITQRLAPPHFLGLLSPPLLCATVLQDRRRQPSRSSSKKTATNGETERVCVRVCVCRCDEGATHRACGGLGSPAGATRGLSEVGASWAIQTTKQGRGGRYSSRAPRCPASRRMRGWVDDDEEGLLPAPLNPTPYPPLSPTQEDHFNRCINYSRRSQPGQPHAGRVGVRR